MDAHPNTSWAWSDWCLVVGRKVGNSCHSLFQTRQTLRNADGPIRAQKACLINIYLILQSFNTNKNKLVNTRRTKHCNSGTQLQVDQIIGREMNVFALFTTSTWLDSVWFITVDIVGWCYSDIRFLLNVFVESLETFK